MGLNHDVHRLVAAQDGVRWADRQAQRAAYAPGFVYDGDGAGAFGAVGRIQGGNGRAGDGRKPLDAFLASWRALVDRGRIISDGVRVGSAIRVATTRALRLRQCSVDAAEQGGFSQGRVGWAHPAIVGQPGRITWRGVPCRLKLWWQPLRQALRRFLRLT